MQTFYATLAQITATILGILVVSVAAYFVFLQERTAQFDDKIEQEKITIREILLDMRANWPWTLALYLPLEFEDSYRSGYPNKGKADLVFQAATDLIFQRSAIEKALQKAADKDSFGGPWRGRAYFWTITQAITVLTVGAPDTRTKPEGVFPSSATGPGFSQWRNEFDRLGSAIFLLGHAREQMMAELQKFFDALPADRRVAEADRLAHQSVQRFFSQTNMVKEKLTDIDKQVLLKRPYSFRDRVHTKSVLILSGLSVLLGVFLPLLLLAWKMETTAIAATVILASAFIATIGTLVQFGWDVVASPKPSLHDYLAARWYSPLLKELGIHREKLQRGGLLDRGMLVDAMNSPDRQQFPPEVSKALSEYEAASGTYNDKTIGFNKAVIDTIRADTALGSPAAEYRGSKESLVLYPAEILNETRLDEIGRAFVARPVVDVSIEVNMPRWTHVAMKVPGEAFAASPSRLRAALDVIRKKVANIGVAREFLDARKELTGAAERLSAAIESAM